MRFGNGAPRRQAGTRHGVGTKFAGLLGCDRSIELSAVARGG